MYTEKDNKTVRVLGETYSILFADSDKDNRLTAASADGITDYSIKEIVVGYFEPDGTSLADLGEYQRKVIRHEIVHAFLYESGLAECSGSVDSWATNEEMVDWIARQHSNLHKAFKEAGCL